MKYNNQKKVLVFVVLINNKRHFVNMALTTWLQPNKLLLPFIWKRLITPYARQ